MSRGNRANGEREAAPRAALGKRNGDGYSVICRVDAERVPYREIARKARGRTNRPSYLWVYIIAIYSRLIWARSAPRHEKRNNGEARLVVKKKEKEKKTQQKEKEKKREEEEEEGGKKRWKERRKRRRREKKTRAMISQAVMICRKKSLWIGGEKREARDRGSRTGR